MQGSQNELRTIFDTFDADKNGTIELSELSALAEKLGEPMTQDESKEVIHMLDTDGDGKISFPEFKYWWETGKKGKLQRLVYLTAKAMKMRKFVAREFQKAGISLDNHQGKSKPDKFDFSVAFGDKESANSISVNLDQFIKGDNHKKLMETIKGIVPDVSNEKVSFIVRLPSSNSTEAKKTLDQMIMNVIKERQIPIEDLQNNPFFKFKSIATQQALVIFIQSQESLSPMTQQILQPANAVLSKIGEDFYSIFNMNMTVNSSINQFLEEPIYENALKGFKVKIFTETNQSALGKLRKFAEKSRLNQEPMAQLLTLIRSTKFNLKIKSPDQLQKFLDRLGIKQMVNEAPLLKDVLEDMSPVAIEASGEDQIAKMLHKVSQFALKHIENNIDAYVVMADISVAHLNLKAKNVMKIHQMLFNEH